VRTKPLVLLLCLAALAAGCGGGALRPSFRAAPGWHGGSARAYAWASTIAYRDCRNCVPPHETIAALPPDGIVIQLSVVHASVSRDVGSWPPRIQARSVEPGFEGVPSRYGVSQLFVQSGRIQRYLYVWFGRAHPTPRQLAAANAELARLSL
jgi:hypothetical protein